MFNILFEVKATKDELTTVNGINAAIERASGDYGWFEDMDEFEESKREGFTVITSEGFTLMYN